MGLRTHLGRFAPALALVLAVFVLYAQTARHAFVAYDTGPYLTANPRVLSGLSLDNLRWAFTSFQASCWHPLTWISHMLDVEIFGLGPAGHQLENAAWHAANALLVLVLFQRLGLTRPFAFAGALLFAVHPLRVESVAWIVERKDLLAAFFGLASLLAWISWSRERAAWKLAAALLLYACSLMSKAMLVTLPFLLLLLEFWPLGRTSLRARRTDLATLVFLGLALATSTLALRAVSETVGRTELSLGLRLENALDSYTWYLTSTFWPTRLACLYPFEVHEPRIVPLLLDAALLLGISSAAWLVRRRLPGVLVGWLWFIGALVPVIGIVQVGLQAHADRFSYFPGLGISFALCYVAERELLPRVRAPALAACGCLALVGLGLQSWQQVATWRDTETLALQALEVTRDNYVACDMLGSYYTNTGRLAEAVPLMREAVRIDPGNVHALTNLGTTLVRHGDLAEAEAVLQRAGRLEPGRWQVWGALGALYFNQRRYDEALSALDRAVALQPSDPGTWLNRGRTLLALGRFEQSRDSLERALGSGNPDPLALASLAWVLASDGPQAQPQRAVELAEQALRNGGPQAVLLETLAFAAAAKGDFGRAVSALEQALAVGRAADPDWAARIVVRLAAYRAGRVER